MAKLKARSEFLSQKKFTFFTNANHEKAETRCVGKIYLFMRQKFASLRHFLRNSKVIQGYCQILLLYIFLH